MGKPLKQIGKAVEHAVRKVVHHAADVPKAAVRVSVDQTRELVKCKKLLKVKLTELSYLDGRELGDMPSAELLAEIARLRACIAAYQ